MVEGVTFRRCVTTQKFYNATDTFSFPLKINLKWILIILWSVFYVGVLIRPLPDLLPDVVGRN
jgi:hypothetical protein